LVTTTAPNNRPASGQGEPREIAVKRRDRVAEVEKDPAMTAAAAGDIENGGASSHQTRETNHPGRGLVERRVMGRIGHGRKTKSCCLQNRKPLCGKYD
jgi:hypothetical protein